MEEDWQRDLERWLEPYLEDLGNKTLRRMCPAYIAGLTGPGDRKSIQPMAARAEALSYDRLHHFIGAGLWDSAPLEQRCGDRRMPWLAVTRPGLADHRRHGAPQEGKGLGRCRAAIRHGAGQERELPDLGVGDAGLGGSSTHAGPATVPAGKLD